ncbi:MAG: lipopolysaccharide kinase, partial [Schaalia georgiae]|nr:lipopolysaccharide kinase [Schaalia georgiae]
MEIGGYELGTIIHMGANGPLWLTETSKGPGVVAIRGEREARGSVDRWRAWAGIDSPHVVRLLDVVRHEDGQWAVVQEYIEGRPLDIALASHALRSPRTRRR